MSQECLMSGCQRKFSMENYKKESAHKVAKRNAIKTSLKPRLRISIYQLSLGNRLRIEQSGVASSTKVPPYLKQRESLKLKGWSFSVMRDEQSYPGAPIFQSDNLMSSGLTVRVCIQIIFYSIFLTNHRPFYVKTLHSRGNRLFKFSSLWRLNSQKKRRLFNFNIYILCSKKFLK